MIKRCKVKAVSKFKGLLVDEDKAWFNATKEAKANLPDLKQFIGQEIDLYLVDGKDHTYSGIAPVEESCEAKQCSPNKPTSISSNPIEAKDRKITRLAALKISALMLGADKREDYYYSTAEKIIKWVNEG